MSHDEREHLPQSRGELNATLAAELRRQKELGVRFVEREVFDALVRATDRDEGATVSAAVNEAPRRSVEHNSRVSRSAAASQEPSPAAPAASTDAPASAEGRAEAPSAAAKATGDGSTARVASPDPAQAPWMRRNQPPSSQAPPSSLPSSPQSSQSAAASVETASSAPAAARETLDDIREALGDCTRCPLHENRTNIVFGTGAHNARLMIVGEAPGEREDRQGEPFVGAAGQLLTKMIVAMGLRREDVYIANVLKCRPPENRDPAGTEVAHCSPFLERQIHALRPEVIISLGRHATSWILGEPTALSRVRGTWCSYGEFPVMPTWHPAYLLRTPAAKRESWADLQQVMGRLGLGDSRGS